VPHDVRAVADAPGTIEVLVDRDPTPGQRGSPTALFDLQNTRTNVHGVVPVHGALVLQGKDQIQILPAHWQKSMSRLRRSYRKAFG